MANKYSKLCIDKEKITDWIQLWCESNLEGTSEVSKTENASRIQYTIVNENNLIKLDFIKCANGLFTITPNVGVNIPISTQIADSIYERVANVLKDSPFVNGFSILISKDDFEVVVELIKTLDGVVLKNYSEQTEEGKAKYQLYQFSGPAGDTVTIKMYLNTGRMQLQGKPLWLFNEIVSLVSENGAKMSDVVDAHLKYCNVDMNQNDIFEEMEAVLGSQLFNYLSTTHKAILSTSFILSKIDMDMPDYSGLIQQALRAFEGFTKKVYAQYGLICPPDGQVGMFFTRPDKMSPFTMQTKYSNGLDSDVEAKLTKMYVFIYEKRHPYLHAGANDFETSIISNRKIADEKFGEIITSMKTWHQMLVV